MRALDGFEAFVAAQSRPLLRSAWLLTRDWHAAEDLVQGALLRVVPRWHRILRREDPGVYVRKVMLNLYLSGRARRWTGEQPVDALPEVATGQAGWEEVDTRLALLEALGRLPARQRAVVVLRYFDDLSEAEAARVLGCAPGTVKSQTSKALSRLREMPQLRTIHVEEAHR